MKWEQARAGGQHKQTKGEGEGRCGGTQQVAAASKLAILGLSSVACPWACLVHLSHHIS